MVRALSIQRSFASLFCEGAGEFIDWLIAQPEARHVAIAAHSAFLLTVFNAVRTPAAHSILSNSAIIACQHFEPQPAAWPIVHVRMCACVGRIGARGLAAVDCDEESTRTWFGTGEMRSVLLTVSDA